MAYRSAEEVYKLLLTASYPQQLEPIIRELRRAGGLSHVLAGLVDLLQRDEEFRRSLIQDGQKSIQIGRTYGFPRHEVFALVTAATLLHPNSTWPDKSPILKVGPTKDVLARLYRHQPIDESSIRPEAAASVLKQMAESNDFVSQIVSDPCTSLGICDLNRAEFVNVYLIAALKHWATTRTESVVIVPDFLYAANLSEEEVQRLLERLCRTFET
jgi:hypothetical protein